ncbi:hypothetical protein B4N84_28200 [Flavobacterium sp. IR1]|nr:hypothetical protein B4N84_28200 [Flavobacterium sp. IR1]
MYAYDPVGAENFAKVHPEGSNGRGSMTYVASAEEALEDANVCFIFTEWGEVKAITPQAYKELMRTPLVYDGRNIHSVADMQEAGVEYHSIGRQSTVREGLKESNKHELQAARS